MGIERHRRAGSKRGHGATRGAECGGARARACVLGALAIVAVCIVAAAPCSAQSRAEKVSRLDSIAAVPVKEGRVAGLAVAVVQGSDTLLLRSYGKGDLEWDAPLTADAVFQIGSVTKQFTAASILKLRDAGKLDLDADMTAYLPDYPTQGHRIPVRRLLDHTSGIKGYTEMRTFGELAMRTLPRDSLVARIAAEPFDFAPGEALIYNNSGYFLLGRIIEKVSGRPYEEYVEQELFAPLGMERSSYCSNSEVVARRAHGYQQSPAGLVRAPYVDHTWPYAAGSLCSSVGDLITWLRALHGGRVLAPASYREMITPGTLADGTPVRYALGLVRTPDAGGRAAIHHGGAINGFLADTRYYPAEDLYVVVLVNTTGQVSPAVLATAMVDVLLPRVEVATRSFEGDVAALAGTYAGPSRGRPLMVKVAAGDGGVTLASGFGQPAPLAWIEGWTFALGGQRVTFTRSGDTGPATAVHLDAGTAHYVLHREPGG